MDRYRLIQTDRHARAPADDADAATNHDLSPTTGRRPLTRRAALTWTVGFGVLGLVAGAARNYNELPDAEDLMLFFDHLALRRASKNGGVRPGWVRKWQQPVSVRTYGLNAIGHRRQIREILAAVTDWTGVPFRMRAPGRNGNEISIYFLSRSEMKRNNGPNGPVCRAQTRGNNGRIHTGRLEISDGFTDCLAHEFMHAIGFDNHWPGLKIGLGAPSVLADRYAPERRNWFTKWDELAIKTLYHPDLPPGTRRDDALPIARAIVNGTVRRVPI